jgi:hypothetical protein
VPNHRHTADETNTMDPKTETATVAVEEMVTRSPRTHIDSTPLPTDSMVTVPLSEAGTTPDESVRGSILQPQIVVEERRDSSRPSSTEILKAFGGRRDSQASVDTPTVDSPTVSVHDADADAEADAQDARRSRALRRQSDGSGKSEPVDWAELEKKEEQEPEGEGQDKVGTLHTELRSNANSPRP